MRPSTKETLVDILVFWAVVALVVAMWSGLILFWLWVVHA